MVEAYSESTKNKEPMFERVASRASESNRSAHCRCAGIARQRRRFVRSSRCRWDWTSPTGSGTKGQAR